MKESFFKLKKQTTEEVIFKKNDDYKERGGVSLDFIPKIEIKKLNSNEAEVTLTFSVFKESQLEEKPFFISVKQKGHFEWGKDTPEDAVDRLLSMNAPAILLSYIRSIISQITAFSGFPALIVPLIDFTK